jgi:hypothetical protein
MLNHGGWRAPHENKLLASYALNPRCEKAKDVFRVECHTWGSYRVRSKCARGGSRKGQPVQGCLERWRRLRPRLRLQQIRASNFRGTLACFSWGQLRRFEARHCVIQVLAIPTQNRLHLKGEPFVRATGHLRPKLAPGAFKEISPAHA